MPPQAVKENQLLPLEKLSPFWCNVGKVVSVALAIISVLTIVVGIVWGEGLIPKMDPRDGGMLIGGGCAGLLVSWIFWKIFTSLENEQPIEQELQKARGETDAFFVDDEITQRMCDKILAIAKANLKSVLK